MNRWLMALLLAALGLPTFAAAAAPSFDVEALACLPLEDNAAVKAQVDGLDGGDEVRLYYRRLNPVGAFYYGAMDPSAGGEFWSTFPRPEDREQHELTEQWWEVLKTRDWVKSRDFDFDRLREYLEEQNQEAAEYYVAVYDASGEVRGRSETLLTEVRENDCYQDLTAQQRGWADNLTVGETSIAQANKEVFHWLCDGIVTRIDTADVLHPDEFCRACVVGLGFVPPLSAVAAGVVSGAIIEHPPTEVSPRQP